MNDEASPSRLGRGLNALFNEVSTIKAGTTPTGGGFLRIPVGEIHLPGSARPPDEHLVASVKKIGVLQPVLVARGEDGYRLLAGSRRVQAARDAGLADVPALIIPPDRAGDLDVFIQENLTRSDLTEFDRLRLRDQWMRETGRDAEAAKAIIPDLPPPPAPITVESEPPSSIWKIATGMLSAVSLALLVLLLNVKPLDQRPVIIPVEFIQNAPATENPNAWMNSFRFPGQERIVSGSRLIVTFGQPGFQDGNITPTGARNLSQLAAVASASENKLRVRLLLHGGDATINRQHAEQASAFMLNEGLSSVVSIPLERDPDLGSKSLIVAEIVPVN
jgi:hypothetical protein